MKEPFYSDTKKEGELKKKMDELKKELEGIKNLNKSNTSISTDLRNILKNTNEETDSNKYDKNNTELERIEAKIEAQQQPQEGDSKSVGDRSKDFQDLVDKMFKTFTEDADELPTHFSNMPIDTNRFDTQQRILLVRNMSEQFKQFRERVKSVIRIQALIKGKETRAPIELKIINKLFEKITGYINQMENPTTITVGGSNIAAQLTKQHNFLNILYIYYKIRYSIFYRILNVEETINAEEDNTYLQKIRVFKKELQVSTSQPDHFMRKLEDKLKDFTETHSNIMELYNKTDDETVDGIISEFMVSLFITEEQRTQFENLLEKFIDVFNNSKSLNELPEIYTNELFDDKNGGKTEYFDTIIRYNERFGKEISGGNKYIGGKINPKYTISFAKGTMIDKTHFKFGVFKTNNNNFLLDSTHIYDIDKNGKKIPLNDTQINARIAKNSPGTIIVYGGSGSGKTHLIKQYTNKQPVEYWDFKNSKWQKMEEKDKQKLIRSTPQNINSSRLHTRIEDNRKIIYDLCGAEIEITPEAYVVGLRKHQQTIDGLIKNKDAQKELKNITDTTDTEKAQYFILNQLKNDADNTAPTSGDAADTTVTLENSDEELDIFRILLRDNYENIKKKSVDSDYDTIQKVIEKMTEINKSIKHPTRVRDFIKVPKRTEIKNEDDINKLNFFKDTSFPKDNEEKTKLNKLPDTSKSKSQWISFKDLYNKITGNNFTILGSNEDEGAKFKEKLKEILKNEKDKAIAKMIVNSAGKRVKESKQINGSLIQVMNDINKLKMKNKSNRPMLPLQECKNIEYQYGFVNFLTKTKNEEQEDVVLSFFNKSESKKYLLICVVDIDKDTTFDTTKEFNIAKHKQYYESYYGNEISKKITTDGSLSIDYKYFLKTYMGNNIASMLNLVPNSSNLELSSSVETTLYFGSFWNLINFEDAEKMLTFTKLNNDDDISTNNAFIGGRQKYKINKELKRLKNLYKKNNKLIN